MKNIFCREVINSDCEFVADGRTESEVVGNFVKHGLSVHLETLENNPNFGKKYFVKKIKSKIYDF